MAETKKIKSMPHNLEAEQSVLGCVLFDKDAAMDIIAEISEEDFYAESHKLIYRAMLNVYMDNIPIDFVTLNDSLEKSGELVSVGGITYITEVAKSVPSSANFKHYVNIVKRDSLMRKMIKISSEITEAALTDLSDEDMINFAEKKIFDISDKLDTAKLTKLNESLVEVLNRLETTQLNKDAFKGLDTGIKCINELFNGLQKSDLILIAARPSIGKTSLAINIVENAALQANASCAVFSLEMPKVQIAQRMLCSAAKVSMEKAVKGDLNASEWKRLIKENEKLSKAKVFIDDSSLNTPQQMLSKCRRLKAKYGLDLVMVDYIQLMSTGSRGNDNRQQEISEISRKLKILARELDVPVLALSQLSRAIESRVSGRPQLSDLRESGAIEQDADIVMFIHRPDKVESNMSKVLTGEIKKDVAELIVAKHRNGRCDTLNLKWLPEYTKFEDVSETYKTQVADNILKESSGNVPMPNDESVTGEDLPF